MNATPNAHLDFSPILEAMKDDGLAALVAMEPHTIALLLHHWNEIFIETSFRETPTAIVITASGEHAMIDSLARTLQDKGLQNARVGFEMGFVPAGIMDGMKTELPGLDAVDGEWILWQLRAVKTEQQLGFIKTAVNACEAGIQNMLESWREGESIHRLLDQFEQVVKRHGASFFCTYQRASAKKWAPFEGRDQRRSEDFIIRANDDQEVLFDLMVKCQAYISDWKRSFYLGTPPQEITERYEFEWRVVQTLANL